MRTITVIGTTLSTPREYQTESTTWGQLKDLVSRDFGDVSNMKAVVKETRATLEREDALLPDEDCTIFLTQAKIKAGAVDLIEVLEAMKEEYNEAIDNVIARVNEGEFDTSPNGENAVTKSSVKSISAEDAAFLRSL